MAQRKLAIPNRDGRNRLQSKRKDKEPFARPVDRSLSNRITVDSESNDDSNDSDHDLILANTSPHRKKLQQKKLGRNKNVRRLV